MKKCPFCRAEILDDSVFCDQCGKELKICLDCHSFVAGKFCTNCSSRNIIMAKDFDFDADQHSDRTVLDNQTKLSKNANLEMTKGTTTPLAYPVYQEEKTEPPLDDDDDSFNKPLTNRMIGITHKVTFNLDSSKGRYDFGRKIGEFTEFFNSVRFISREHAEINYDHQRQCWTIKDMGSSNGTFVNGQRLTPQMPKPVTAGDEIQIAFEKFKFE